MIDGWTSTTIGDQVTLQRGIDITKAAQRPGSVPVVSSGGISSFHDTAFVNGPGVVLGRKGVVGSVYFIDSDYWPHDTTLWVRDFHGNEPRFVYYFFKHMAPELASMDVGSANPTLNRNHVHPKRISWPPLPEQRAIAHILGTLDDKIELNRKMNATLDEIARTLFTSWFVDFDPVRAKAEGRQPDGMDAEIAVLFPYRFVDSELGPIPEGWRIGVLGEIVDNSRQTLQASAIEPTTKYIGLEHMPRRSIALNDWRSAIGINSGKFRFRKGDFLFGKLRPYFHKVGIAPVDGVCSTDILVLSPKRREWYGLAIGYLSSDALVEFADGGSEGTRMPRTSWQQLSDYPVVLPSEGVASAYFGMIAPIFNKILQNIHESRTLAAIRDTLLPQLLSGEVKLPITEVDGESTP